MTALYAAYVRIKLATCISHADPIRFLLISCNFFFGYELDYRALTKLFIFLLPKVIKHWSMKEETAVQTIIGKTFYTAIDHNLKKAIYTTSGERIDIWDETRHEPLKSYTWGVDSHYTVKFNPIEASILASSAADRSIILYDIRQTVPLRKIVSCL
jgi:hypothetical protein